jgi:ribosomal protein S18 acetylase RimI-like enzyme
MDNLQETARVMCEAWKLMVGRLPNGQVIESPQVFTCLGHVPLPFFNIAFQIAPVDGAEGLRGFIAAARQQLAACAHPAMIQVCPAWLPAGWEAIVAELGLVPAMNLTGMETSELLPARRPAPSELEIRRVTDVATACDLATVNGNAYGMPESMFDCIFNMDLWHDDSYGFVGYVDGRPVSSAAAFPAAASVYIALVATMPDCHGKGYAEAVMRQAVTTGQQAMGIARTTLHATDMGRPLYTSMGYANHGGFVILTEAGTH